MKVVIGYPPLESKKGIPLLSQNRQFQWFHNPTYIYPVIPAYAATMLKNEGYNVFWLDGIAEGWSYQRWEEEIKKIGPDVLMIETKTPVVKKHWKIINRIKNQESRIKVVLAGDHVTALPEESMENSLVDYILTGGDYDFLLLNLVNHLEKSEKIEPGIWYRTNEKLKIKNSKLQGKTQNHSNIERFQLNHNLNKLPMIDRELTRWELYAYKNGNYKKTPGAYIMSGRDCWWRKDGGCRFCAWTVLYPQYRVRRVENVLDEIGELIEKYKVKEIMDDTGTFPAGEWLRRFCQGMIERGFNQKINFDCNLRFGVLKEMDYELMAKAGLRFLLYGLESASQETLNKLNKGTKISEIERELKIAKEASRRINGHLEPHVTCMVGYPWESKEEAQKTVNFTRNLFNQGLIDTLQATVVIPYPGTELFKECEKSKWLKTKNWDDYDMDQPVMKTEMANGEILALTREIYKSFMTPKFIARKVLSVRSTNDLKFFWRAGRAVLGHLTDFSK